MNRVEKIDKFIGRAVVSLETANKLGQVADLLIDPISGALAGLAVTRAAEDAEALVSTGDVHGIGPDAVVVEGDQSLVLTEASPLKTLPRAKADLIEVKVITEHGQLLGNISNAYVCLINEPVFMYEVRSSLLDKLLGHAFYFPASLACAFSDDRTALVVGEATDTMERSLEAAARRLLGSVEVEHQDPRAIRVEIRSHA